MSEEEFHVPVKKSEFEAAFRKLTDEFQRSKENPGSYRSEKCVRCFDCMFTTASTDCYQCTYCSKCEQCTGCTHCHDCLGTHNSSYCIQSEHCTQCSYVLKSQFCHECVFCFGCVGLVKKEFHILNRKFRKDEYFRLLEQLQAIFPGMNTRKS